MSVALYRKYRPATFAEVVGQEHVTKPLRTALAAGRVNHAYLFSGPRGCGKTSSARILARSLNCVQGPTPDPCGVCASCIALAPEGPGSLDVVELDAASHGGVDDTRDLRDKAFYMPAESRYRVFIIDEAHMVSTQGFNALLKIVEEPPEHLVFIFATTEPDKVLTTIRSRTHHYPFRLIPPATLRGLLERLCTEEKVTVEPAVLPLVVRAGGGSARDSLSVLDQLLAGAGPEGVTYQAAVALLGVTDAALLDEMVDALAAGDGAAVFGAVDKVVEAGHDPRRFAADLLERLRDLVILAQVPQAAATGLIDEPDDELQAMVGQAERLGPATSARFAEILHSGLIDMRGTTTPRLTLELMCARMLLPAADGEGPLLQRLERLERRLAITGEVAPAGGITPVPPARSQADPVPDADREPELSSPATAVPAGDADRAGDAATAADPKTERPRPSEPAEAGRHTATPERPTRARPPSSAPDLGLPPPPTLSNPAGSKPARSKPAQPEQGPPEPGPSQAATSEPTSQTDRQAGTDRQGRPPAPAPTAAPPESAPPSSGRGTRSLDATDVRRVWPEVLAAVQRKRRTTQILLESATVARVEGSALILTMPSAGMARRVVEAANADLLRSALNEVLGVDWTIRCEAGDGGTDRAGGGRPAGNPRPSGTGPASAARPEPTRGVNADVPGPPEPPPVDDDDIPDDYGEEPSPIDRKVRDPEEVAIELLSTQLGARRID